MSPRPAKFHGANLHLDPVTRPSVATRAGDAKHVPHLPQPSPRASAPGSRWHEFRLVRSLPFGRERRLELLDVGLQRGVVGLKDKDQRGANASVSGTLRTTYQLV